MGHTAHAGCSRGCEASRNVKCQLLHPLALISTRPPPPPPPTPQNETFSVYSYLKGAMQASDTHHATLWKLEASPQDVGTFLKIYLALNPES